MGTTLRDNLTGGARMALELEWKTFEAELQRLLDRGERGRYALVRGNVLVGTYPTRDDALEAGYDRFGVEPFLVQEITDQMKPLYFSHNVTPCR